MAGTRGDVERDERRAALGYEGDRDPFDGDPAPVQAEPVPVPLPAPLRCNKRLHKMPLPGSVRGFRWVRCTRTVDEFGDCRDCDR